MVAGDRRGAAGALSAGGRAGGADAGAVPVAGAVAVGEADQRGAAAGGQLCFRLLGGEVLRLWGRCAVRS